MVASVSPLSEDRVHSLLDQQAILADFGHQALLTDDLDALLQEAAALAAKGLDTDHAKVMELLPGDDKLLLRAGIGWGPDTVGVATFDTGNSSATGYALQTGEPVISDDINTDPRFRTSDFLRRHGITSSINAIICGRDNDVFGVLQCDSRERRDFTEHDVNFLQNFANILAAAIARTKANRLLAEAAEEKALLLRELQHRVNNDIQVISALLIIESQHSKDPETKRRLETVASRVAVLGLIHKRLYAAGEVGQVELGGYIRELCADRFSMHGLAPDAPIKLNVQVTPVTVGHDMAMVIGLILNELLTKSLKRNQGQRHGTVTVILDRLDPEQACLTVGDSFVGEPPQPEPGRGGSGLQLVARFAAQIGGSFAWNREQATEAVLTFPAKAEQ